jgi:hypothetical protein
LAAPAVALGVRGVKGTTVVLEMGVAVRVALTVMALELYFIEGIPSTNGEISMDIVSTLSIEEVAVTVIYEVMRQVVEEVRDSFFWLTIIVLVLVLDRVSVEMVGTVSERDLSINAPSELGALETSER